jgi:hypothetical protein
VNLREIPADTEEEREELERFITAVRLAALNVAAELGDPERVEAVGRRALLDLRFPDWRDREAREKGA